MSTGSHAGGMSGLDVPPVRVLHIMAGRGNGGAELYSTDVILSLQHAGLSQCVVMRPDAPRAAELRAAGVDVITDPLNVPLAMMQRRRVGREIARYRPDIVHCWLRRAAELTPPNTGRLAQVIGWFGNYKDLRAFSHCRWFVGCTPDMADSMQARGVAADHVAYIPTFPSVEDAAPVSRRSLKTPDDARVLLTLSRLHEAKGLETLLRALRDLPDCYLWMAGDGPLRDALGDLAATLGVASRVRFLGWRTDRGALLAAAEVCVLPSRYEPFGTVILDAWSARAPLVACASAGPRAHVRDGENGMLVPIDDVPALTHALRAVLDDPALRARIVAGGYAQYRARYTREAVTQQWLEYYRRICVPG